MALSSSTPMIGLDIGGVLVHKAGDSSENTGFFGDEPLATPVVPGAAAGVAALHALVDGRVCIVSRARRRTAGVSWEWLGANRFLGERMIAAGRVRFVGSRPAKGPGLS